jgi:DNA-binding response OmpR family regulator
MNILVVNIDNNIDDLYFNLDKLQPDWKVFAVNSDEYHLKAIKILNCLDIIIISMRFYSSNILNLLRHIRIDSDLPIVILSKDTRMETLVQAFESGADDFIILPLNKTIFVARLKALVRRREWEIPKIYKRRNGGDAY